jgi:hypothetical protein
MNSSEEWGIIKGLIGIFCILMFLINCISESLAYIVGGIIIIWTTIVVVRFYRK